MRAALCLALALAAPAAAAGPDSLSLAELRALPDGPVDHVESVYNDIYITKERSGGLSGTRHITMSFRRRGSGYTESMRTLDGEISLPVEYTRVMTVGAAYRPDFENLLMIGLGGGSTTNYLSVYFPEARISVVELDDKVVDLAKKYFGVRETERFRIHTGDGRIHLKKHDERYDIVMMDAFRGGYIPFHLLTQEFYRLVRERMSEDGVLVLNLHGGSRLFYSSLATLRTVFGSVDSYASRSMGNVVVVAYDHRVSEDTLDANARRLQAERHFRYDLTDLMRYRTRPMRADYPALTDDFAPVNLYEAITEENAPRWD